VCGAMIPRENSTLHRVPVSNERPGKSIRFTLLVKVVGPRAMRHSLDFCDRIVPANSSGRFTRYSYNDQTQEALRLMAHADSYP